MDSPKRYQMDLNYDGTGEYSAELLENKEGDLVLYEDYQQLLDKYEELKKDYDVLGHQCTIANTKLIKIGQVIEK